MVKQFLSSVISYRLARSVLFAGCLTTPTVTQILSQEASIATAKPEAVLPGGISTWGEDDLAAKLAEFEALIEAARAQWQVPGLSVAIVHKDRILLSKGYGVRESGLSAAVDENTLFAIASNSKAFTAAALAILVDEKKIQWTDRVQDYLPWFQIYDPGVSHEMRICDLLCHRSGLGTFSGDLLWYGTPYTAKEVLERCKHLPPEGPFRHHYGYSNVMFLAAGLVIEQVSGESWGSFVQNRILKKLNMARSLTSVRDLVSHGNFATPHKTHLDRSEPIAWVNWDTMAAAGGIISNAKDMAQWMLFQLKQGEWEGVQLISADSMHEMTQPYTPIRVTKNASQRVPQTLYRAYGLGWSLSDYKGRKVVGHGGGYDGMYSHQMLLPGEQFGIIVLSNSMTSLPNTICSMAMDWATGGSVGNRSEENLNRFIESRREFRKRIDTEITPVAQGTKPSHSMADYARSFRCPMLGEAIVSLENEKLVLRILANPNMVADLEHLHYDTFVIRWRTKFAWFDEGSALFVPNAKGEFIELKLNVPNDDLWFHELQFRR
jgi:CubicO group peptidase (beta-lactamase class C family)